MHNSNRKVQRPYPLLDATLAAAILGSVKTAASGIARNLAMAIPRIDDSEAIAGSKRRLAEASRAPATPKNVKRPRKAPSEEIVDEEDDADDEYKEIHFDEAMDTSSSIAIPTMSHGADDAAVKFLRENGFTPRHLGEIQEGAKNKAIFSLICNNYELLKEKLNLNVLQITAIAKYRAIAKERKVMNAIECLVMHQDELCKEPRIFTNNDDLVKVIAHIGGGFDLEALLANYKTLISEEYGFSMDELIKIVGVRHGDSNIKAVKKNFKDLSDKDKVGCSKEEIIRVVARIGGGTSIEALLKLYKSLRIKEFDHKQIINMASHSGAQQAMLIVLEKYDQLEELFDHEDISFIAGRAGGASAVDAILKYYKGLKEDLGLSHKQIMYLLNAQGNSGGNITQLYANKDLIILAELDLEEIVRLIRNFKRSKKFFGMMKKLKEYAESHLTDGTIPAYAKSLFEGTFAKKELDEPTDPPELGKVPAKAIKLKDSVEIAMKSLLEKGFTDGQLKKIVERKRGGKETLVTLSDYYDILKKFLLTHDEMLQIANGESAESQILGFVSYYGDLEIFGYSILQVIDMVRHGGGRATLAQVKASHLKLIELGFTQDQIFTIGKVPSSAPAIRAVIEHFRDLYEAGYTHDKIVEVAAQIGSSAVLSTLATNFSKARSAAGAGASKSATTMSNVLLGANDVAGFDDAADMLLYVN